MRASTRTSGFQSFADGVGILGSVACAVHCLLAPSLLVLGSALPAATLLSDEVFHQAILWAVIPAALLAFSLGCRKHRDPMVLILGGAGVFGLLASAEVLHDLVGEGGERIGTLASAALLVAAHVRNFRGCRRADCHHEKCDHQDQVNLA